MIIFKQVSGLESFIKNAKAQGKKIGFVPTMGALHQGHISLVNTSLQHNDITVSSIFVNPTQFNNAADLEKYPVTIEADIDKLEAAGCDALLIPAAHEMYPPGFVPIHYQLGYLETILEGAFRPGHYQGVCQIVDKLLALVQPDNLYLGQKDYQQCMVIKTMVGLRNFKTDIHVEETIRETDGLAMSSRNARLDARQRAKAGSIFKALSDIKKQLKPGSLDALTRSATDYLTAEGFQVDYVAIAGANDLQLLQHWDGTTPTVTLIAAALDDIRLIDNMLLS